ncbi:F-box only protein 15-like isoform X1 [Sander lucioperca]|uniref:F-box only protein 15-like isoform X1 n=1 Tax=Sander lucioperca TaxID=283035 RepID=UPI00125DE1F9|nr:F-box only protein 15-like isoform X1 [Sander lucioperca]
MAAGRGEFFRSFQESWEKKPTQPALGRRQPVRGRGKPGPARIQSGQTGGKRKKRRPKAAPSSVSGNSHSSPQPRPKGNKASSPKIKTSPSNENVLERLPSEILLKILSCLDPSSLSCISHVSKLFYQLANDDAVWHKIYMSEFGSQTWKPKSLAGDAAQKVDPVEGDVEDRSPGHWKKMYFRTLAGQEVNKWRRELRHDNSPYTGLPRQTERVLRNLNVSWELTVCDCYGRKITMEQSRAYFFESSVIVRWSGASFLKFHHIRNIQLYGVRKETLKSPKARTPGWRSLIIKQDNMIPVRYICTDKLVKLRHLPPCFLIGTWRGSNSIAFIMVSLHFHKLVEKSLLGSPVCPFSEPMDPPPADNSDPEFGLHGYTLHFVLHNTGAEIMSGHFRQLSCRTIQVRSGLVELRVINRTNLSEHRPLSGNIKMPWKSGTVEGAVENCCIVSLTLLDEFQKPFWCVSSPISIMMAKRQQSFDYSGEHFVMDFKDSDGQVKMKLVWFKEQKQFFLISLTVYISIFKVNKHFSRAY